MAQHVKLSIVMLAFRVRVSIQVPNVFLAMRVTACVPGKAGKDGPSSQPLHSLGRLFDSWLGSHQTWLVCLFGNKLVNQRISLSLFPAVRLTKLSDSSSKNNRIVDG